MRTYFMLYTRLCPRFILRSICAVLLAHIISPAYAAHTLSVTVTDHNNAPVTDAHVVMRPEDPLSTRTDTTGTANFSPVQFGRNLIMAHHPSYGRTSPIYPYITSSTSLVIQLPPLTSLRIATYNLEGFDQWRPEQHISLARIFWTVQPDVVALQECPKDGLRFRDFSDAWLPGYHSIVSTAGLSFYNGLTTRYPLSDAFSVGREIMTRDLFGATITLPGWGDVEVMSVHFKAGSEERDGERRNDEATFVGAHCATLSAQARLFFLAGDFNEDPDYDRPPSRVHDILAESGAKMVKLTPRDDSGSKDTFYGSPSFTRRLDYLYPCECMAVYVITSRVFRTDTAAARPLWLSEDESFLASDHFLVYTDIVPIPEPCIHGVLLVICLFFYRKF